MPVLIKRDEAILFVHVPKCGGSSFLKCMGDRGWHEVLSVRGFHADQLDFLHCSPQHMHADLLQHLVRPEAFDKIVTLVREPLARLKSEYAWQRQQKMTDLHPGAWVERVLSEYRNNHFICDNHIRPQHEFLLQQGRVFKLEDDGIERALDLVSPDPVEKSFLSNLMCRTSSVRLKETRKSQAVNESFKKKKSMITDFYAKDYKLLKYDKHN